MQYAIPSVLDRSVTKDVNLLGTFIVPANATATKIYLDDGTTEAMVKVLETTSSPVTTAGYLTFASGTGNYLDDIVVLKLNGDTVETETQVYNAANELTSQVVKGVTVSYAYDQFGRLTQKSKTGSRVANFYYNYGDKLTKVSSNFQGEGTVTYTYSGDQKRRSRSVSGGAMTKYRVDQGFGVVNEENSGGTLLSTYIHHPGRQIGTVLATSEGSTASSGTWNYYFQDAIGSTRSLWDEDGDRLGKYDYTPFGGKYGNTGEEITRKFTGHDWDNEARLYHTAHRQYSPDTGRWLTRDPLGMVDGPNVYAYVVNNPVTMVDALGLCANILVLVPTALVSIWFVLMGWMTGGDGLELCNVACNAGVNGLMILAAIALAVNAGSLMALAARMRATIFSSMGQILGPAMTAAILGTFAFLVGETVAYQFGANCSSFCNWLMRDEMILI